MSKLYWAEKLHSAWNLKETTGEKTETIGVVIEDAHKDMIVEALNRAEAARSAAPPAQNLNAFGAMAAKHPAPWRFAGSAIELKMLDAKGEQIMGGIEEDDVAFWQGIAGGINLAAGMSP